MFKKLFRKFTLDLDQIQAQLMQASIDEETIKESLLILKKSYSIDELKKYFIEYLSSYTIPLEINHKPKVILFTGVNGSGKTSTIGKLTYKWKDYSIKVIAADTYRYAAIEQLEKCISPHCTLIKESNIDPAALVYKGLEYNIHDIILIDTAGRLSNNIPLIDQLSKITRSIMKHIETFEHIIILDSMIGNNILHQYEIFNKAAKINSVILTKIDINTKPGIIFNLCRQYKANISMICTGEKKEHIQDFSVKLFVDNIL